MKDVLSVKNMRESDAATIAGGIPGRELMMRAAKGVFEAVVWKPPVAIVCGSGNNAGDGYALALLLSEAGIDCTVFTTSDRFSEDGKYYYDKCKTGETVGTVLFVSSQEHFVSSLYSDGDETKRTVPAVSPRHFDAFNTIVDCLLGTGFKGQVRPELAEVIKAINESDAYKVSVDINSGLNGDTGMADICVVSDLTVSIGGFKPGHFLGMAKDVMKQKVNIDIGIKPVEEPYPLIEDSDIRKILGTRRNFSNKGTYGYTALIGGSTRYSGAIRLAAMANAAMRSGAGVVKIALPASLVHDVTPHILESTLFPLADTSETVGTGEVVYDPDQINELTSNVRTVAFGMGIGTGEGAEAILRHLLTKYDGNLIIDADGLTLLSRLDIEEIKAFSQRGGKMILTPHIKEFSRLCGKDIPQILDDPIGNAADYAKNTHTIVLLKGPSTIITDGERTFITDRGCAGMATAGSGDVLSGIMAATVSYVDDKCLAAAAAAYINGAAGERASKEFGDISMTAGDTVSFIHEIIMGSDKD